MKFLVILLAIVAFANAAAVGEKEDPGFLHKLTKWFSWDVPLFGPIRTTPKPLKSSAESVEEPQWDFGPFDPEHPYHDHEVSSDEATHALDELYHLDSLKDILPPFDSLLDGAPIGQYDGTPITDIHDPHIAEMIQNIIDYMQQHPNPHADNPAHFNSNSESSEE